ncbi:16561_t:CDS:1, partial [Funneliformis caledonium]
MSVTNAKENVKSSAKIPSPTGPELSKDLQKTLDNLSETSLIFYNNL